MESNGNGDQDNVKTSSSESEAETTEKDVSAQPSGSETEAEGEKVEPKFDGGAFQKIDAAGDANAKLKLKPAAPGKSAPSSPSRPGTTNKATKDPRSKNQITETMRLKQAA